MHGRKQKPRALIKKPKGSNTKLRGLIKNRKVPIQNREVSFFAWQKTKTESSYQKTERFQYKTERSYKKPKGSNTKTERSHFLHGRKQKPRGLIKKPKGSNTKPRGLIFFCMAQNKNREVLSKKLKGSNAKPRGLKTKPRSLNKHWRISIKSKSSNL